MNRLSQIKNELAQKLSYKDWKDLLELNDRNVNYVSEQLQKANDIYTLECVKASLEKARKDLYSYWIFFEEGKPNTPRFTIKIEDPSKVYQTAYDTFGPQVEELFYSCVSHEESITNPKNIVIL